MTIDLQEFKIFMKPGSTDMRKSINGLSIIAEELIEEDLFSKNLFLFTNKRRNILKVLYWDRNGFCLWLKRLEKDKFPWDQIEQNKRELTVKELHWLLRGIDFFNEHKKLNFSSVL